MTPKRVLVLGVGNILRGDDGVGVHAIRELRERCLPPDVEIVDGGTVGFELLPWFAGRERVVLVDAIRAEGEPGTIYRVPAAEIASTLPFPASAHGSDIGPLLQAALALRLPAEISVIGVVPSADHSIGLALSPPVRARLDRVVDVVLEEAVRPATHAG